MIVIGSKRGLIKMRGNLMTVVNIFTYPGFSVGGVERMRLKLEKASAPINIPIRTIIKPKEKEREKIIIPKNKGTKENMNP